MALNHKRQKFIEEYLKCWNATEAARRAKYAHPNSQGPRLLLDVGIKAIIKERLDELHMSADEVLERLARIARANPGAHSVNASDIIKALKLLGKHQSLFKQEVIIQGGDKPLTIGVIDDWSKRIARSRPTPGAEESAEDSSEDELAVGG